MAIPTELAVPTAQTEPGAITRPEPEGDPGQPLIYSIAAHLHEVLHLSREEHCALWRLVLDRYRSVGRPVPRIMQRLCEEAFLESLLENEVFWALAGEHASRDFYSHATDYVSAVYATAALVMARRDGLASRPEDQPLLVPAR